MDGWTVVRYGRRRQRSRQTRWNQGYGPRQVRMDRAPSFPGRGGNIFFQVPNQPVPPPGNAWNSGPQFRSYAQAVRQGYPRPARRWVSPRAREPDVRRQPADPQLGRLVRKLHALIKMVHHLQNVAPKSEKPEPRMIARMVDILTGMIKPAAPTERTADLIMGNAKNWGHTTCVILRDHYEASVEEILGELSGILTANWKSAFEVATRWAKRNLSRITQDSIDHAEALVTARMESRQPGPAPDPQPTGSNTVSVPQPTCSNTVSVPQPTGTKTLSVQTRGPPQSTNSVSVGIMTDPAMQRSDWGQVTPQAESPLERREARKATKKTRFLNEAETAQASQEITQFESPAQSSTRLELDALFDESDSDEEGELPLAPNSQSSRRENEEEQVRQAPPDVRQEDNSEDDLFEESFDRFTSPAPQRFKAYRHPNTQRKLTDWDLVVEKKWLIIGDSNLCSLPDFFNKNLQIDSFPGSHFRHGQALMEKTVPPEDLVVEKIILSFGINGRMNKSKETTVKNVQGALRSAKRKFPYAEIWIPLVNFSSSLPSEEQDNLRTLNDHIERNMPFIPLLPEEEFQTEGDDIHWTRETGAAMFDHWMAFLNS